MPRSRVRYQTLRGTAALTSGYIVLTKASVYQNSMGSKGSDSIETKPSPCQGSKTIQSSLTLLNAQRKNGAEAPF